MAVCVTGNECITEGGHLAPYLHIRLVVEPAGVAVYPHYSDRLGRPFRRPDNRPFQSQPVLAVHESQLFRVAP